MLIQYRHISAPDTLKIYDTRKSYRKNFAFTRVMTQQEFDNHEVCLMARDKIAGKILEFKMVREI